MLLTPQNGLFTTPLYREKLACVHCHQSIKNGREITQESQVFCCMGCAVVWRLLREDPLLSKLLKNKKNEEAQWLDNTNYNKDYVSTNTDGTKTAYFYAEGLDCHACFWTLEKIPQILKEVRDIKVDVLSNVVTVTLETIGRFETVMALIGQFGHRTHPLQNFSTLKDLAQKEKRRDITRIGIAGACAGNAMIYSVANYAGADGHFLTIFHVYSALFSLPALTYCAWPFYVKAWGALKQRIFSMDFSISLALILGGGYGIYVSFFHGVLSYIDSLSMLVFLLLLTRFSLKNALHRGEITNAFGQFFKGHSARKVSAPCFEKKSATMVPIQHLVPGDFLWVNRNELIPADGHLTQGVTYINESSLTGESVPILKKGEAKVYAGTVNDGAPIVIKVAETFESSKIGNILKKLELNSNRRTHFAQLADSVAKRLFSLVIVIGLGAIVWSFYKYGSLVPGMEKFFTLLIVTCPCALGLATPMLYQKSLSEGAKRGILIKDAAALEKASQLKNIFFDKTGTLTATGLTINSLSPELARSAENLRALYAIESQSIHPVATALCHHLKEFSSGMDEKAEALFKIFPGLGVEAQYKGDLWSIKRSESGNEREHTVSINGAVIGSFSVNEHIDSKVQNVLQLLRQENIKLHLLSGDSNLRISELVQRMPVAFTTVHGQLSAEEKEKIMMHFPQSAMVGDGANDSLALSAKDVLGISVNQGMPAAISAAQVWLQNENLLGLVTLIRLAHRTDALLKRNIALSLSYNVLFIGLTLSGLVSPLLAAIAMPVSALSITASVYLFGDYGSIDREDSQ